MSRVSGCLWLGVALVLALVAGGAAFFTLQRATAAQAGAQDPVSTTVVVVAVHPVAIGALLSEADLTTQSLPANAVPQGVLPKVADVAGQVTTVALNTGELILTHHLVKPDITSESASFTLPEGKIAVTLGADDLLSTIAIMKSGDHVDILYSLKVQKAQLGAGTAGAGTTGGTAGSANSACTGSDEQMYSFGSLQNVEVVGVIGTTLKDAVQASSNDPTKGQTPSLNVPARAYVLALSPQDALVLKFLKDSGAVMDLAVRNVTDDTDHTATPVDLRYLVDKFQLPVR